jgi:hypothetical protein
MINNITIGTALSSLAPNKRWQIVGDQAYENIVWLEDNFVPPTKEQVDAELERLNSDWESKKYSRTRESIYPSEKDLIVALWEMVVENRPEAANYLQENRDAVKNQIPKEVS